MNHSLSILRLSACIAVVVLHASAPYIYQYGNIKWQDWHTANLLDSAMRWCVPVFVMISGALNLKYRNIDLHSFWRKRLFKITPIIVFWSISYTLYSYYVHNEQFSYTIVMQKLISGVPYYHLYFLFLITGLYLITPFIAPVIHTLKRGDLIILIAFCQIASMISAFIGFQLTIFTWFLPYIGYYIAGYLLTIIKIPNRFAVIGLASSVIITSLGTWILVDNLGVDSKYGLYLYSYLSPNVFLMSISLFVLGVNLNIKDKFGYKLIKISNLT